MNNAIWGMLNETEKALLREVEPKRLNKLDEDGLANLHDLIRRARRKYTKLYRRRASEQVSIDSSRKKAHLQHARTVAPGVGAGSSWRSRARPQPISIVKRRRGDCWNRGTSPRPTPIWSGTRCTDSTLGGPNRGGEGRCSWPGMPPIRCHPSPVRECVRASTGRPPTRRSTR